MISIEQIQDLFPELEENYKYLHQHPELGFTEKVTFEFVVKKLTEYGIEAKRLGRTGVIATIQGGQPGKTVAIRADMDALPIQEECDLPYKSQVEGKMHACGHDAHTAMLLCAGQYLNEHKDELNGSVRLIFQPAEEGPASMDLLAEIAAEGGSNLGGAASMVKYGALEGVDACFALHVLSANPVGTFGITHDRATASSDVFELTIHGKGGHSSMPNTAVDPLGAMAAIIEAYNALTAREIDPMDCCTLSIGAVKAGEAWNVIPDSAYMTGGLRAFSNNTRDYIFKRLKEIAEGICTAHRCTATFVRHEGYAPTINAPEISMEMLEVGKKLFGEDKVVMIDKPMMGSEDVGYYFQEVPGGFGWLGSAPAEGPVPQHNPKFRVALEALHNGVLFHVNMVQDYLNK